MASSRIITLIEEMSTLGNAGVVFANASKVIGMITNAAGYLYNDGAGNFSYGSMSSAVALSGLSAAGVTNTIDNLNFAQAWNWSTATTQIPLTITADAITTGSLLSLTSSYASGNSTNGLLYVANTSAVTNGIVARIQANSRAGSGLTVLASGNVGIGTTGPGALLDVAGTTGLIAKFASAGAIGDQNYITVGGNYAMFGYNGTTHNAVVQGIADKGIEFNVHNATFGLGTAMFINTSGNVGIGTTSPAYKLDVNGSIQARSTGHTYVRIDAGTNKQVGFLLSHNATTTWNIYNDANDSNLYFYDQATNVVTFKTGGGVGIGAVTPGNMLDVKGAIAVGTYAGTALPAAAANGMAISGNVGIGTTAPTAALHLKAGVAGVGGAPLKLTAGVLNTTPEIGAIEYDGTHFYGVDGGGTRRQLDNTV